MIISHKYKFIFVHVPKTAGISIETALLPALDKNDVVSLSSDVFRPHIYGLYLHSTINTIAKHVDVNNYYKFCFVRNSWDRHVSLFSNLCQTNNFGEYNNVLFKDWLNNDDIQIKKNMPLYIQIKYKKLPQLHWATSKNKICMDFIGRFENLVEDFSYICSSIGIKVQLPLLNQSQHGHYSTYYDQESKEIVSNLMKQDIDYFNFKYNE